MLILIIELLSDLALLGKLFLFFQEDESSFSHLGSVIQVQTLSHLDKSEDGHHAKSVTF